MFEEIKAILTDELDISEELITFDAEIVNDLKLNSLEITDLIVLCEERFGIEIQEEDIHGILTVGDLCDYIESRTE